MDQTSETPIAVYLLVELVRKRAGLAVVGENQHCVAAVEELADKPCDVLLLSSVGMLRTIAERANGAEPTVRPKLLLFGMEENPDSFLETVRLGACGYLRNEASSEVGRFELSQAGKPCARRSFARGCLSTCRRMLPRRWKKSS
jgi:AmiR/NasT family two-component response regulator